MSINGKIIYLRVQKKVMYNGGYKSSGTQHGISYPLLHTERGRPNCTELFCLMAGNAFAVGPAFFLTN
jgi:hypothetical protein